mgnify:CR=1 FL=1
MVFGDIFFVKSRILCISYLGRSLEFPALFGDPPKPARLPVEIRGCPWTRVETGIMCLERLISNIGIICDHPGPLCEALCHLTGLAALG